LAVCAVHRWRSKAQARSSTAFPTAKHHESRGLHCPMPAPFVSVIRIAERVAKFVVGSE
jgi:hypothetical protein